MDKKKSEKFIEFIIKSFAAISIVITVLIVFTLVREAIPFFKEVPMIDFLTGTQWNPSGSVGRFGIVPLLVGTFMIVVIAAIFALPIGLGAAIYMSEYAKSSVRGWVKPILEILAGIPSVVYGFFALKFITPVIQYLFPGASVFNGLSAAIAVGIMIIPTIASLSEDALRSVPNAIREAAYGLGITKFETVTQIVVPAGFSGIMSSFILGISRAIGETMIVAIAAGATPVLTFSPLNSIQTMTGYIVNKVQGEVVVGSLEYQTIYAVALVLFILTLIFNYISKYVAKKYQIKYD